MAREEVLAADVALRVVNLRALVEVAGCGALACAALWLAEERRETSGQSPGRRVAEAALSSPRLGALKVSSSQGYSSPEECFLHRRRYFHQCRSLPPANLGI